MVEKKLTHNVLFGEQYRLCYLKTITGQTTEMCDAYETVGTKGSDVYDSTGSALLDLSIRLVRGADAKDIRERIGQFSSWDSPRSRARLIDAFVLAFHTRNVRGGKGERDLFQELFVELYICHPTEAVRVLKLIPKYGCWRDMFELASLSLTTDCSDPNILALARLRHDIMGIVATQLRDDARIATGADEGSLSLCAKWAPRERNVLAKYVAKAFVDRVGAIYTVGRSYSLTMRYYRHTLSIINKELKTVEVAMCAGEWASINPSAVPGRAGALYKRAFLNLPSTWVPNPIPGEKPVGKHVTPGSEGVRHESEDRVICAEVFKAHYAAAAKGQAKVHGADTLYPHQVVKEMNNPEMIPAEKDHLLAVWRSMVQKAKDAGGLGRSIFMSDFSGSMQSAGPTGDDTPYWVSMALGLLGAEVCSDEFKDRLMTFQSEPTWHTFKPEDDLFKRICSIHHSRVGQGTSTDFQKAMDLVLATLKEKRMRPGQEPENLIVLTDMAFDQACGSSEPREARQRPPAADAETSAYTGNSYRHVVKTAPWETHISMIQESFRRAGEDMWGPGQGFKPPRIVIWNLSADPKDIHAKADQPGVAMLSGWSPSQFKVLCEAGPQPLTALDILRMELDDPQYDAIREALRDEPMSGCGGRL